MLYAVHVNWSDYFVLVGCIAVIYWIVVGVCYFRREIKSLLSRKRIYGKGNRIDAYSPLDKAASDTRQATLFEGWDRTGMGDEKEPEQEPLLEVYALAGELRAFIHEAGMRSMIREELMQGLRMLVDQERYRPLNEPKYRIALNNVVAVEAEERCAIHFDALELNEIWEVNNRP
jgi:hypothetical protein